MNNPWPVLELAGAGDFGRRTLHATIGALRRFAEPVFLSKREGRWSRHDHPVWSTRGGVRCTRLNLGGIVGAHVPEGAVTRAHLSIVVRRAGHTPRSTTRWGAIEIEREVMSCAGARRSHTLRVDPLEEAELVDTVAALVAACDHQGISPFDYLDVQPILSSGCRARAATTTAPIHTLRDTARSLAARVGQGCTPRSTIAGVLVHVVGPTGMTLAPMIRGLEAITEQIGQSRQFAWVMDVDPTLVDTA